MLFALAGCRQDTEIVSYEVKQPQREKIRMLTAIIPDAKSTYVVKLSGPEAAVAEQKKSFDDFVASIRLKDNKDEPIAWTAPDHWAEEKGAGELRIASFRIEAGGTKMETVITLLPKLGDPGEPNSLLDNVNRWRNQLEMPPAEVGDVQKLPHREVDGRKVILADLTGLAIHKGPARVQAQNPHAAGMPPAGLPKFGKPGKARVPFAFDAPDGWEPTGAIPPAVVAYLVPRGPLRAKVTLTKVGGGLVGNFNRWRDQVGLPEIGPEQIRREVRPIKVASVDGNLADIVNPNRQKDNHILGVVFVVNGEEWFIKMIGPTELVSSQRANFEAFARSFKAGDE
jgi:hypothetical protein